MNDIKPPHHAEVDLPRLEDILENGSGERGIARFFKEYPRPLYWTLCTASGHDRYMFSEFPLGSQYKCDLVVLNSYSGVWEVYFIELEPVDDPIFTKKGTPSLRASTAIRQVDDWREYVERNRDYVRSELVRWAKKFDILRYSSREEPTNYSGDLLADTGTVILENYIVIIGRSSRATKEIRGLVGRYSKGHNCELITYDRVLHLARTRYSSEPNWDHFHCNQPD